MNEVSPEDLRAMMDDEDPVVIDVLPHKYFRKQHVPGAINIEVGDLDIAEDLFDKNRVLVVYCMDEQCGASPKAVETLENMGFENVYDMPSGIDGWKQAGFAVKSSI
mgnify:CR=1 FL=1